MADHSFQADEAFSWDLTGNRTDTGYQTGANNRLLSDGTFNYTYTGEGGLATRTRISTDPADDHRVEYGWDHRRRLVSAVYKNNSGAVTKRVEIDYDMFDRRIAKRVDSNGDGSFDRFERWVYDGDDVLLDFLDIDGEPGGQRGRSSFPPARITAQRVPEARERGYRTYTECGPPNSPSSSSTNPYRAARRTGLAGEGRPKGTGPYTRV